MQKQIKKSEVKRSPIARKLIESKERINFESWVKGILNNKSAIRVLAHTKKTKDCVDDETIAAVAEDLAGVADKNVFSKKDYKKIKEHVFCCAYCSSLVNIVRKTIEQYKFEPIKNSGMTAEQRDDFCLKLIKRGRETYEMGDYKEALRLAEIAIAFKGPEWNPALKLKEKCENAIQ